ncbi:hypothetical protein AB0395_33660 [Streptosporangium sp. NPDC051023]|uniref:hypothetical protein n=1 Tax=Streptosporangium sp. NPDC051023 TaxID=3155410 RepID=UPI00344F5263
MTDYTPTPLILDATVLSELARGDAGTIGLVQSFDADGQSMVVSALAITWVLVDARTEEAADAMHGLAAMEHVTVAPLKDAEQAATLAEFVVATGQEIWDAHVAAIADVSVCPILTFDAAKWAQPSSTLNDPLHVIEIRDPEV